MKTKESSIYQLLARKVRMTPKREWKRKRIVAYIILATVMVSSLIIGGYRQFTVQAMKTDTTNLTKKPISTVLAAEVDNKLTMKSLKVVIGIPGGLADKNNNPGNLIYAGQKGAIKGFNGFAMFNTPEDGYRAVISQIKIDQQRDLTLRKFITKYAPPRDNNTWLYIQTVSKNLNVDSNIKISDLDTDKLAQEMVRFESQTVVN